MKKIYITNPVYYVNDKPHIGHAYTTVAGDVLARFHRRRGEEVFLLAGTDEHGLKIEQKAKEAGQEPQKFVDEISAGFKDLWDKLDIKYDNFIRTTNENHKAAVQKVLQALFDKGAIYRGLYEGLYCVGCEQFKNESDLVNGRCPDHDTDCEMVKEESYLLKMTDLQEELIEKIEKDEFKIRPEKYKKEILSFLKGEKLNDVSISRKNVKWGIPLPFDREHTTYVWFDAFLSYITGLGWDGDANNLPAEWPADVQLIGKDILRVHATIWPIMLMHLGIELPKLLFTHGHLLSGGRKMSKTIGNVISIDEMLEKFGVDGTRYLLMSAGTFGEDVDVTMERLTEKYNADLANGLGNLLSRTIKLYEKFDGSFSFDRSNHLESEDTILKEQVDEVQLDLVLRDIWILVRTLDKYIEDNKPWQLVNAEPEKFKGIIEHMTHILAVIADDLIPFIPDTSKIIKKALESKKVEILFPRIK